MLEATAKEDWIGLKMRFQSLKTGIPKAFFDSIHVRVYICIILFFTLSILHELLECTI